MIFKRMQLRAGTIAAVWLVMFGSVAAGLSLEPHQYWADFTGEPHYEQIIPHRFGDWEELPNANNSVVNPVVEESLKRIYSQTLARSYLNRTTGRVVMLSIAYGRDQTNDTQLHTPDQCYPSQGFKVESLVPADIPTSYGPIKSMQMVASLGVGRREPVTYFIRVGDAVTRGSGERNMERIKMAMRGYLVDGTLVRVSEVTRRDDAFAVQDQFLADLMTHLPKAGRHFLLGAQGA